MLNRFIGIIIGAIAAVFIGVNIFSISLESDSPLIAKTYAAVNLPVQISYLKLSTSLYRVQIQNTNADDVYGIQLTLVGGTNLYGSTTKYIPDIAPNQTVTWDISFATPPNGSVMLQVVIGSAPAQTALDFL